jgi:hypothetical protein
MKKAVALTAITIMSIAPLAACSSDDDDGGDTPSGDTTLDSIGGDTGDTTGDVTTDLTTTTVG